MKIKNIGSNMTELALFHGMKVLVSYETPVAMYTPYEPQEGLYRTRKKWSATTTRHINKWLSQFEHLNISVEELPQEYFDNLLEEHGAPQV